MSGLRKLNFGCGSIPLDWSNLDVEDFGQEYVGSTELFADNTFDIIACHCALQITEFHNIEKILAELHRILKPGGVLRISLPDIVRGFQAYQVGNIDWLPNGEDNIDERFSAWLTWYSTTRTLLTRRRCTGSSWRADLLALRRRGSRRRCMGRLKPRNWTRATENAGSRRHENDLHTKRPG